MTQRLGSASIALSFSDRDGLRVKHGTDAVTLLHVPPEQCRADDWNDIWRTLRAIEVRAADRRRGIEP